MKAPSTATARQRRGAWYTDPDIVAFLARWALAEGRRRVLEPACGDGAFLDALSGAEVTALELDRAAATAARGRLPTAKVLQEDFLVWALDTEPAGFDAAVGNPPFVRYQLLDEAAQAHAARLFARAGLPFTRHTNAWVPFVLAALAALRPGGRLAMVVPAELLHVLHAEALRRHLLEHCSRVVVVDPIGLWFGGTLQGVVLLLAEKADGERRQGLAVVPVAAREDLDPSLLVDLRFLLAPGAKWMPALLSEKQRSLLAGLETPRFADVAEVDVGIVTGANAFFLVDDATVERRRLRQWARPMLGRSEHVRGAVFTEDDHAENVRRGLPAWFLDLPERPPQPARAWLTEGERAGLDRRYKCRVRTPWWAVPSVWSAPVGMLKRSHDHPRLFLNQAGALWTDTAYRVRAKGDPARLVAAFVNSLTALSCELEGRHYGGGVLELVPSEIERVRVPDGDADLAALDALVRSDRSAEDVLLARDPTVLADLPAPDRDEVHAAWRALRNRRQRRAP